MSGTVTGSENVRHAYHTGLKVGNIGEKHPLSRLTEDDVKEIRRKLDAGSLQQEVADEYGISQSTVSEIKTRRKWRHLC